jgi:hypothetical protein
MLLDPTKIDRPTLIKWALIITLVIALFFLARKAIKAIRSDVYSNQVNAEIQANELSYPLNQYITLADQIHDAMAYLGTKNNQVTAVIQKLNTLSDVLQLIKAFGSRNYYGFWGAKTLPQWFSLELSTSETAALNAILKQKSINFTF